LRERGVKEGWRGRERGREKHEDGEHCVMLALFTVLPAPGTFEHW
jgi:hypothetical protein